MLLDTQHASQGDTQWSEWNSALCSILCFLGYESITIQGKNLQKYTPASSVLIGERYCEIWEWFPTNITCRLPQLPPGKYNVHVQAGNWGYAMTK